MKNLEKKNKLIENIIFFAVACGLWAFTAMASLAFEQSEGMFYIGLLIMLGFFAKAIIDLQSTEPQKQVLDIIDDLNKNQGEK